MRFEIFSQGRAQEQVLERVIRANGDEVRLWRGWVDCSQFAQDSPVIIVATGDPIGAVLTAYTIEGHTSALSPAIVGARVKQYCELAQANWQAVRAHNPNARLLITENHTKTRHWAASMGYKTVPEVDYTAHGTPNEQELRTLCERDLAATLGDYSRELAAL
jgi:hypothetical protein